MLSTVTQYKQRGRHIEVSLHIIPRVSLRGFSAPPSSTRMSTNDCISVGSRVVSRVSKLHFILRTGNKCMALELTETAYYEQQMGIDNMKLNNIYI